MTGAQRPRPGAARVCAAVVSLAFLVSVPASASAARPAPEGAVRAASTGAAHGLPSERTWHHDTAQVMLGSHRYVDRVSARIQGPLAINLDIDNSSMATIYRPGTATPAVLSFALYAEQHDIALLFNTGRTGAMLQSARQLLTNAGYTVSGLCGRKRHEGLAHSKQRCRRHFIARGYTIVANVGNRSTDFSGRHNYGRAYRLPNYGERLG